MPFRLRASLAAVALVACQCVQADVFVRAEVRLTATASYGEYEVVALVPSMVRTDGTLELPPACRADSSANFATGEQRMLTWTFACERHLGPSDALVLPFAVNAAAVRFSDGDRTIESVVTGSGPLRIELSEPLAGERSMWAVAADYVRQGVVHIAIGWDHLAFVLCLCLLTLQVRSLLFLITAFTLGHSLSMALSFLGVIEVAIPPIEAIIALSIVWVAREAVLAVGDTKSNRLSPRHVLVVSGFGLLHGLGFASALSELGVTASERLPALAFFNLGVELGQVVFVLGVTGLFAMARPMSLHKPLAQTALYGAGSIGAFWTIERIAAFPFV